MPRLLHIELERSYSASRAVQGASYRQDTGPIGIVWQPHETSPQLNGTTASGRNGTVIPELERRSWAFVNLRS